MGEDIGKYGGICGATAGSLAKYGKDRIMDAPVSETAFIGTAIGAAASRFARPPTARWRRSWFRRDAARSFRRVQLVVAPVLAAGKRVAHRETRLDFDNGKFLRI